MFVVLFVCGGFLFLKFDQDYKAVSSAASTQVFQWDLHNLGRSAPEAQLITQKDTSVKNVASKIFLPQKKLFDKVLEFNKQILDWFNARQQTAPPCDAIEQRRNDSTMIGRGNTNNVWATIEGTNYFVGTSDWFRQTSDQPGVSELRSILKSARNFTYLHKTLLDRAVYDVLTQADGVKTFTLSSRSDAQSPVIDLQMPIRRYYDCHVTSRMRRGVSAT